MRNVKIMMAAAAILSVFATVAGCSRERDFVTGKDAQTIISMELDRRSVRKDVAESDYLPDKSEIHVISGDEAVVNENKQKWLAHFTEIFEGAVE